jgi:hypothetical protein
MSLMINEEQAVALVLNRSGTFAQDGERFAVLRVGCNQRSTNCTEWWKQERSIFLESTMK